LKFLEAKMIVSEAELSARSVLKYLKVGFILLE
jgi:hypothetical protein